MLDFDLSLIPALLFGKWEYDSEEFWISMVVGTHFLPVIHLIWKQFIAVFEYYNYSMMHAF